MGRPHARLSEAKMKRRCRFNRLFLEKGIVG
ncbi:hypothetical protein B23_0662 [Geobacillus thermoleovorans B23]|nr:hypothetical protein B23_0662 [Geobacillus thermoleovorans B23]